MMSSLVRSLVCLALLVGIAGPARAREEDKRFPLFAYLTGRPLPALIAYTPSQLDPRQEANQRKLATSSMRADLEALRPHFDGLVLYGYHEACTPRVLAIARDLKYRAVLLAVWDPRYSRPNWTASPSWFGCIRMTSPWAFSSATKG